MDWPTAPGTAVALLGLGASDLEANFLIAENMTELGVGQWGDFLLEESLSRKLK